MILLGSASEQACLRPGDEGERLVSTGDEDKDDTLPSGLRVEELLCPGEGVLSLRSALRTSDDGLAALS